MTIFAFFLIAGALGAALVGAVQQGRALRRLRDEFDAVARPQLVDTLGGPVPTQPRQMFASLYAQEDETDVVRALSGLPGVPAMAVAIVLGLAGTALTVAAASRTPPAPKPAEVAQRPEAPMVDSLQLVRARSDSLERQLGQLRDSLRAIAARDARPRTAVSRSKAPTKAPRQSVIAPPPALPPMPAIGTAP